MNTAIANILESYDLKSQYDYETALKEIVQLLALLGLWRSKFYEHAAFYGGTALRLFYGLKRFSEDLDFSLVKKDEDFNLIPHLKSIEKEIEAFGFKFSIEKRSKAIISPIESAFIKVRYLELRKPTDSINISLLMVNIWETFITESFSNPDSSFFKKIFPGAPDNFRLLVITTTMTVLILLLLNALD